MYLGQPSRLSPVTYLSDVTSEYSNISEVSQKELALQSPIDAFSRMVQDESRGS